MLYGIRDRRVKAYDLNLMVASENWSVKKEKKDSTKIKTEHKENLAAVWWPFLQVAIFSILGRRRPNY